MKGALAGVRVLEWGELVSAPYCTKLLRELGAAVDKIEPPAGDPMRCYGPFRGGRADPEGSGLFLYLNSGKRSIQLDVATARGRDSLHALLARSDVLVTNQPLRLRQALGLDAAGLRSRHPGLVTAALTVFGDSGAHAGVPAESIDAQAASGTAWVLGDPSREPLVVPLLQADYQAGAHAAAAIVMALLARRAALRRGDARGETIDIASADVLAAATGTNSLVYLFHGLQRWARSGRRAYASGGPYPYTILPCRDGAVCLIGRARVEWERLVEAMGRPAWTREARYQDLHAMGRHYPDEVDALLAPWLQGHTRAQLLELAEKHGFPLAPLRTMDEVLASEQLLHRRFLRTIDTGAAGPVSVPGVPWRTAGQPAPALPGPAPRLGEHTGEALAELEAA